MTLWGSNTCGGSSTNLGRARSYDADSEGTGNFTDLGSCGNNSSGQDGKPQLSIFEDEGGGNDLQIASEVANTIPNGDSCDDNTREVTYSVSGDPAAGETYWVVVAGADGGGYIETCYDSEANSAKQKSDHTAEDISGLSNSSYKVSVWAQYTTGVSTAPQVIVIMSKLLSNLWALPIVGAINNPLVTRRGLFNPLNWIK